MGDSSSKKLIPASLALPHDAAWSAFILQERLWGKWVGKVTLFGGAAEQTVLPPDPPRLETPLEALRRELLQELVGDQDDKGPVTARWAAEAILAQPCVIWEGDSQWGYRLTVYSCAVPDGDFPWLAQRLLRGVPNGKAVIAKPREIPAFPLVEPLAKVFGEIFDWRYGRAA